MIACWLVDIDCFSAAASHSPSQPTKYLRLSLLVQSISVHWGSLLPILLGYNAGGIGIEEKEEEEEVS